MLSETEKWQISGEYRQFTQQIKSSGHSGRHPVAAEIGGEQRPGPQR